MQDKDIPHRTLVRETLMGKACRASEIAKERFKVSSVCYLSNYILHLDA